MVGVEGHALISSCKSTTIHNQLLNNHWQEDAQNPPKKDTALPRTKEKSGGSGRSYQDKMKSYAHWVGNLQAGKTIMPKKLSHCCKGSRPHITFRQSERDWGSPIESDFEGQKDLITGLPQHWGKQVSTWRAKQNLVHTRTHGKGTVTLETGQNLPVVFEGLLWRHGLAVALCCKDGGTGSSSPERCVLA